MSRIKKQLIYGFFYICVLGIVVLLFLSPKLTPAPSCSDNIQNQGETGVDCGGPCLPCYLKQAKPLEESGIPYIFKSVSLSKVFAVVSVVNNNADLGLDSFSYSADFLDGNKNLVGTVSGYDNIFPNESKYLIIEYDGSAYDVGRISDIDFKINQNESWKKSADFLVPSVSVSSGPIVSSSTGAVVVSGVVQNQSAFSVPSLRVTAFLYDKYGNPLFAGKTLLNNISGFGTSTFYVYMPQSVFEGSQFVSSTAQVFLNAEE